MKKKILKIPLSLSLSLSLSLTPHWVPREKLGREEMRDALEHCRQLLQMGPCEFTAQNDGDSDDLSIPEHNFKVST
jgi:hypothetical protein